MTSSGEAGQVAAWCLRRTVVPAALAALGLLAIAVTQPAGSIHPLWQAVLNIAAVVMALATIGFCGLIGFDALLFRLIASYEDTMDGCVAVDDLLARMRLKPPPATTRPLAARIEGTRRLMRRQQAVLALCLVVTGLKLVG